MYIYARMPGASRRMNCAAAAAACLGGRNSWQRTIMPPRPGSRAQAGSRLVLALHAAAGAAASALGAGDFEASWVLREVAAMPDGYPRQVIAATPVEDLEPVHVDPLHPWNDTLAVEPEVVAIPGPEVRVRQGGRVRVHIENRLHTVVSIHWHGIHMLNQGWMDGAAGWTECGIPPHGHFTYDFTVDQPPGTHWW